MGGGRKRGKNKKKGRGKNRKENKKVVVTAKTGENESTAVPNEDLDALVAAIEATGVATVKEEPKATTTGTTKTKRKRKRNRRRKKTENVGEANGAEISATEHKYSEFKKENVQDEVTVLKSIFADNFVRLPDAALPWQAACPSFRIAQV